MQQPAAMARHERPEAASSAGKKKGADGQNHPRPLLFFSAFGLA
jgi:hypothetical protein